MKILLVNTNRMKPAIAPIGLDYLADSLVAAGHEPRLLDLCFSGDIHGDIEAAVTEHNPGLVGLSVRNTDDCYFSGGAFFLPEIKEVVQAFKRLTDAPVVLGGVGFSIMPEAVMEFCEADYGIAGEGEFALVELIRMLRNKLDFSLVSGLLYRGGGTIHRNPGQDMPLDKLPRARSFADNQRYFRAGGQAGFETKRGCDMKCVYCADPVSKGRRVRLRSPKLVVEELKTLLAQGIDHFHTCDCEFNVPGQHAKDVCRAIIDAGLGGKMRWYAYCSIAPFDAEMADLFKQAGCAGVDFGADSGSDAMLASLGRHFRADDLARTADLCHQFEITFMYDLLLGGPGETLRTARESIELMQRIDADCVGLSMGVRIYEGTTMAQWVRSQGPIESNPNLYGATTGNPGLLRPIYYISPEFGPGIVERVREMVGSDSRFFLPSNEEAQSNYNYSDNTVLVRAIADGARGAYWDILRRINAGASFG